ncbi:MAG: 4-(cytidine 5'-diphospho)-2-C-methyl-D-erythritol kinase [Candidatus Delongbacteria bacterium]|nr:4-(cytidine 5'-diphospho)-2-C-methyl-D-erythritol kinase [Candidatus Delongbacteria bacterium]
MIGTGTLVLKAPAKINFGLDILHRREDGYHELKTMLVPISLADTLRIQIAAREQFSCSDTTLPQDAGNLVIRALRLFEESSGIATSLNIHLEKRIPTGAGLGGGSSDAAALLRGVNQLYGKPLSRDELLELAALLGSDIPFFLYDCPCYATGRGEMLVPTLFPSLPGLIVFPGFPVSTAIAYQAVDLSLTSGSRFVSLKGFQRSDLASAGWRDDISNDFESVIFRLHPELGDLKKKLYDSGAGYVSLSGSGSAVYALYESRQIGDEARLMIPANWSVFSIETLLHGTGLPREI